MGDRLSTMGRRLHSVRGNFKLLRYNLRFTATRDGP